MQHENLDSHNSECSIAEETNDIDALRQEVLTGLRQTEKLIPSKFLYDERGSQLFDQICELEDYYLTRTESAVMRDNADAIAARIGSDAVLVEYGSGSSTKTRLLLTHLDSAKAYLPVDISETHLLLTAELLKKDYPDIDIHPIVADFTTDFAMPAGYLTDKTTVYFPGSTIGNLEETEARTVLRYIRSHCGENGGLLIGFDLQKDPETLELAYNDRLGVTSVFTLNLLERLNRELGSNFQLDQFAHHAIYNSDKARIEIALESLVEQRVTIGEEVFHFQEGEKIRTEYSHKYTVQGFAQLAEQAGLTMDEVWMDEREYFAVMHLSPSENVVES